MPLKASPDAQSQLLELQAIDTRLHQLDHSMKTVPELAVLAELATSSEALQHETMNVTGSLEDARLELGRIEADVAVVEGRIVRDVARLDASSSVKDVAGLESELVGLRNRQLELEEIELGVMERVEGLEATLASLRADSEELQAKIAAAEIERDAALGALTSERTHSAANRSVIVGKLPEELIALYERQRDRYGFGASLLRGGVSSASGLKLNENDMADVRAAAPDDVLLCPDSNAILVRTNESGL
jgi:predicted  nucleic acid-binding Zn-ribbon protein